MVDLLYLFRGLPTHPVMESVCNYLIMIIVSCSQEMVSQPPFYDVCHTIIEYKVMFNLTNNSNWEFQNSSDEVC